MKLPRLLAACSPWRQKLGPWVRSPVPGGWSHTRTYRRELAPWVRAASPVRSYMAIDGRPRYYLATWVLWLLPIVACLVVGLLLASRADAQEWRGSMQFRGEEIRLVSCCGPMREPVIRRELEAGYARARADLDASGHQHVALPPLGTPEAPYTIEIARDPGCPGGAQGCSRTVHPEQRWTLAIMRDKARKRAAPSDHEAQHRWCLLVRPIVVPPRSVADLVAMTRACLLADHGAGKGYRWDVAGRRVPVRKGKP